MNLSPEKIAPPVAFVLIGSVMLIVGITGIIPLGNPQPTIAEPLPKAIVLLFGVLLIISGPILVWREQESVHNPQESVFEPSKKIFKVGKQDDDRSSVILANRSHMQPLEALFQKAQKEIILYAVQHSYVVHHGLGLLQAKLEAGCKVRILLMAAKNQNGAINPNVIESESHRTYTGLIPQIESSTYSFESWYDSLTEAKKRLAEIRTYQQCPIMSLTIIDKDEPNGLIQSEILLYGVDVREMPHYILTKKNGSNLFKAHCVSFDRLWNKSEVLRSWHKQDSSERQTAS
jgi:hypothetical protein